LSSLGETFSAGGAVRTWYVKTTGFGAGRLVGTKIIPAIGGSGTCWAKSRPNPPFLFHWSSVYIVYECVQTFQRYLKRYKGDITMADAHSTDVGRSTRKKKKVELPLCSDSEPEHQATDATSKNKNGPKHLKFTCFRCGVIRWCVDFKEGKYSDLCRTSMCLICELSVRVETLNKTLDTMKVNYEGKIRTLEEDNKRLRQDLDELRRPKRVDEEVEPCSQDPQPHTSSQDEDLLRRVTRLEDAAKAAVSYSRVVVNGVSPDHPTSYKGAVPRAAGTSIQKPEPAAKPSNSRRPATKTPVAVSKGTSNPHVASGRPDPNEPKPDSDGEGFQLVRRGKKKKKRRKTLASKEVYNTNTSSGSHRTSSHDDPVTSSSSSRPSQKAQAPGAVLTNCLIGDSMVRKVGPYFTASNPANRVVGCLPGAGMERLTKAISNLRLEQGNSLTVMAGGNDLFLRKGRTGNTEPVMSMFVDMVGKVKEKTNKAIIVGLIPRMHLGGEAHSKAVWLNKRLARLCLSENLRFLDPWEAFKGQKALFNADGIHFNDAGARKFSRLIDNMLFKSLGHPVKRMKQGKPEAPKVMPRKVVEQPLAHGGNSAACSGNIEGVTGEQPYIADVPRTPVGVAREGDALAEDRSSPNPQGSIPPSGNEPTSEEQRIP
jgi:hypothetical protein